MKFKVLILIAGLSLVGGTLRAQDAAPGHLRTNTDNYCESPRYKQVIDAIQCMAKKCDDPNGENKKLYEAACDQNPHFVRGTLEERTRSQLSTNADRTIVQSQLSEQLAPPAAAPAAPAGPVKVVPEEPVEVTTPPNPLAPCDCLAAWDKRNKDRGLDCQIDLCKTEDPKPTDIPKEFVPAQPPPAEKKFLFEGSGCSLNALAGSSEAGIWLALLTVSSALGFRRKK